MYLLNSFTADKFDQFWAVNRKLMELSGETNHFKYIPFRCYFEDIYRQKLIKPVKEDGSRTTLKDLLTEMFPDNPKGKSTFHGKTNLKSVFYFSCGKNTWTDSSSGHSTTVDVRTSKLSRQFFAFMCCLD